MKKSFEAQGKTIEDAVSAALKELNIDRDSVSVEVLERPKTGFLGIGGSPARVRVSYSAGPAEGLKLFLEELFDKMGANAEIDCIERSDGSIFCELTGADKGVLIGRRGETLDALQHIAGYVAGRDSEANVRVIIDSEGYREKREASLIELAHKTAAKAVKYRRNMALEPMNAYSRHIIHAALEGNKEVTTHSAGNEPNRYVIISVPGGDRYGSQSRPGSGRQGGSQRPPQRGYNRKFGDR